MNITDFVSKSNYAYFDSFRANIFYYNIINIHTSERFQFQIPLEETGGATFSCAEKSVTLMRWIRKSIENKTFIKI